MSARVIRFILLELQNYAGLRSQSVDYGTLTNLSGKNGEGKTSIGGAPVWILWGKDLVGSDYMKPAYSPRPSNYEYDRVYAALILSIDGTPYKFAREIKGKTNSFYVNDVPKAAKEYDAAVASLIDQEEFMALYFPPYFFKLNWTKQRELLMRGVSAPANKTVFAEMSRTSPDQKAKDIELNPQAAKLAELVKKHSLDDLQAMHKKQKPELDKAYIAAQSRTKTLREQLERLPVLTETVETLQAKEKEISEQLREINDQIDNAASINAHFSSLKSRFDSLQQQVLASKNGWPALKDEAIADTCRTCKQPLQDDAVAAVVADKEQRKAAYQERHKDLQTKRDEAKAALDEVRWVEVSELRQRMNAIEAQYDPIYDQLRAAKDRDRLTGEVEAAAAAETATLSSLRESIFILDAIKAYRAKEAELQAADIQAKFTTLSIRLFKWVESRGEWDPDFSVQVDGKDYDFLSTGERIGAGLELIEVLHNQSGLIAPVFVDGVGEYTGSIKAFDQVITGRAVPDQPLLIETR